MRQINIAKIDPKRLDLGISNHAFQSETNITYRSVYDTFPRRGIIMEGSIHHDNAGYEVHFWGKCFLVGRYEMAK